MDQVKCRKGVLRMSLVFATVCVLPAVGEGESTPVLERLTLGEVKPAGWLRDWCETAKVGYTRDMESVDIDYKLTLNPDYRPKTYYWQDLRDPKTKERIRGTGFYCAEAAAYWFGGLIRLAYQLDDRELKEIIHRRVDPYLKLLGPKTVGLAFWMDRTNPKEFAEASVWQFSAVPSFARALGDYYSVAREPWILEAAEHLIDDPQAYAVAAKGEHYMGFPHAAYEILRLGGGAKVRETLDSFCRDLLTGKRPFQNWRYTEPPTEARKTEYVFSAPFSPKEKLSKYLWQHGVITQEDLMSIISCSLYTGERRLLDNMLQWQTWFDKSCRQPHGAMVSDEFLGMTSGRRATETCDVVGDLALRCELLSATGEGRWGDDAERNFFNAAPATVSRDFRQHCYFQVPNMVCRRQPFRFSTGGLDRCRMSRNAVTKCCQGNTNRLLPEYIRFAWLRSRENGLAAALWCPCDVATKVGKTAVNVRVRTDYPFGEVIAVTVEPSMPVRFPLHLRMPTWCARPTVSVNGERVSPAVHNGFALLDRIWRASDRIELKFPMSLRLEGGFDHVGGKPIGRWNSVCHGPLLYALGVPEKDENTPADSSFRTDYALDPKTALASAKIVRKPMPAKWNWPFDAPVRIEGVTAADGAQVALIPYGCTRLRMTMFPEPAGSSGGRLGDEIAAMCEVMRRDMWHGYSRTVFAFDGEEAWVVEPKSGASGRPWCWTMEWPDVFAKRTASLALLAKGYCFVTLRPGEYRNGKFVSKPGNMTDARVERSRAFQRFLVERLGFAPKANLIGMSWGGFYSVRYAAAYPEAVRRIYLDAPLLDFSTLNGWNLDKVRATYGIANPNYCGADDPRQPVNLATPIAKAGIPIFLLYGGKDRVVPPKRNCELFVERFRAAGGTISIERRDDFAHHPHGLEVDEQQRFVDFFGNGVANGSSTM